MYQALAALAGPAGAAVSGAGDGSGPDAEEPAAAAPAQDRAGEAPGQAALLARFRGKEGQLRRLAPVFLDESGRQLADLAAAVSGGDAPRLQRAAHSLKGAVGLFGAPAAAAAAQRLEALGQAGDLSGAPEAVAELEAALTPLRAALGALVTGEGTD